MQNAPPPTTPPTMLVATAPQLQPQPPPQEPLSMEWSSLICRKSRPPSRWMAPTKSLSPHHRHHWAMAKWSTRNWRPTRCSRWPTGSRRVVTLRRWPVVSRMPVPPRRRPRATRGWCVQMAPSWPAANPRGCRRSSTLWRPAACRRRLSGNPEWLQTGNVSKSKVVLRTRKIKKKNLPLN